MQYEPVPPSKEYEFSDIGFETLPSRGYVRIDYKNGAWGDLQWQTDYHISVPIHAIGIHYGQSAFEGLKVIRSRDNTVHIFRPNENAKRMQLSCDTLSMARLPEELFLEACRMVVSRNLDIVPPYAPNATKGTLYLRPVLFGSEGALALRPSNEYIFAVYATPLGNLYGASGAIVPALDAQVLAHFDRAAPMGTGGAKLAGNYGPVLRHTAAAKQLGFGITLHLDSRTRTLIDEFSTSNFLALQYDPADPASQVTLVVPTSVSILKSVTTMSAVEAATMLGWKVDLRPVEFAEVVAGAFQEVAAAGTAACITPVRTITYYDESEKPLKIVIGNGQHAGPGFLKMFDTLTSIQCGDQAAPGPWLWPPGGVAPPTPDFYAKETPLRRSLGEKVL